MSPSDVFLAAELYGSTEFVVMHLEPGKDGQLVLCTETVSELCDSARAAFTRFPVVNYKTHDSEFTLSCSNSPQPLLSSLLKPLTVINSSTSGTLGGSTLYFGVIKPLLHLFGVHHVYVATSGPSSVLELAQTFTSSATVIMLGGDTSFHEFINNLPAPESTRASCLNFCLVPTGTGNAIASSLASKSPSDTLKKLFRDPKFEPLSGFKVLFPAKSRILGSPVPQRLELTMFVVLSWGFHAALVADSDDAELRKLGQQRFVVAAKQNAAIEQSYSGTIEVNNTTLEPKTHSYFLVTPLTHLESGYCISPRGQPLSGNLWLLDAPGMPGQQIFDIAVKGYDQSKHIEDENIEYIEVKDRYLKVQVDDQPEIKRRWCVDGRIVICEPGYVILDSLACHPSSWTVKIIA